MSADRSTMSISRSTPAIAPVPDGVERPLWSVMIPTYNGTEYLRESLLSVLSQDLDLETMQIEVVDDHSTEGDPEALVAEIGEGRVSFYRQPRNTGHVRNLNTCLQRAHGSLVHLLHDDDYVHDGFYAALQRPFDDHPGIGAAYCRGIYMNPNGASPEFSQLERPEPGPVEGLVQRLAGGGGLAPPSIAVRRSTYERLNGFDERLRCAGEDWEMWVRISAHYPVWFEPEPLATYRVRRPGSLTFKGQTPGIVRDMRRAQDFAESYLVERLPRNTARRLIRQARVEIGWWAVVDGMRVLVAGNVRDATTHARAVMYCITSPAILSVLLYRFALRCGPRLLARRLWQRA